MISSQSRMVLNRWATMIQVQPRRRMFSSGFSVMGSKALVASSSIRIDGFAPTPWQSQAAALSAAEIRAAFFHRLVITAGPGCDILMDTGVLGRLQQLVLETVSSHKVILSRTLPSNSQIS